MSDTTPPRKEPPPSELRIGAAPRPVTRLSRRTLVVATALVAALVFAALWYALGIRPLRFTSGPELYNTNAKPTDALANMRDSYADLTRPKPAPSLPQPVPQLGPPLPGDLGRSMLQQQTGASTPAPDPEAERRRREREQAATSVVFFTVSARPAALAGAAPGEAAGGGASTPSLEGTAPQSAGDDLSIQNGQSQKERFSTGILTRRSTRHSAFRRPAALTKESNARPIRLLTKPAYRARTVFWAEELTFSLLTGCLQFGKLKTV
jgi:type IV secretion system protein TrbI